ncbi:hypothetical protein [Rubinisphaera sp.]|uniref:hypothetical protein n=1 Tax=Rubinisphaera sp. TaxID=2024857 RepID=UPI002600F2B8|nr:hypothetical protein [Rubinisphaera sp.]
MAVSQVAPQYSLRLDRVLRVDVVNCIEATENSETATQAPGFATVGEGETMANLVVATESDIALEQSQFYPWWHRHLVSAGERSRSVTRRH